MEARDSGIGRRELFKGTLGAAALAALSGRRSVAASDKVVLGIMGCGGRGSQLASWFAAMPDVEIAYLCDVDERRFDRVLETVESSQERSPELVGDFRRILEDKSVDALVNATPDHWHALATVMACQAGKDVYVEKPLAHDLREGRLMVAAARKYERVVQVGTQTRSAPYVQQAIDYIRGGQMGEVHLARVYFMMEHPELPRGAVTAPPAGLDWEMWCGPAPLSEYSPGRWWFEQWDYSCGGIAGDAVHQLDLTRMILGLGWPESIQQVGGVRGHNDGREIPDTQLVTFDYGPVTMMFEAALWTPYMKKIPNAIRDSDLFPDWPFCGTRVEFFGTEGFMYFGRQGGGWQAYDREGRLVRSQPGRQGDPHHLRNFIDCIRSRQRPNAEVEDGHISTALCHLANISYRAGNRQLRFDPATQSFPGDEQANRLLGRSYREPWVLKDEV